MIGKASFYINLSISALIIALGLYSLVSKANAYKDDLMAFVVIGFVYGICLLFDILCITLQRNNFYNKINTKGLLTKGKILFVIAILGAIGSLLVFASLVYSLSIAKRESPQSVIIVQIITLITLLLHSISAIINLVQYKKLLKINKNLQTDMVNNIGDNMP